MVLATDYTESERELSKWWLNFTSLLESYNIPQSLQQNSDARQHSNV